jgi:hypothetical protein
MPTVEQVAKLIAEFEGDPEGLARAIVALDDEATKETRVIKAAETR